MIQRKQSLYLLLAAGIQTYFAFGTYFKYTVDGMTFSLTGSGIVNFENEQIQGNDKTLILSLILAALAVVSIFMFKKRKQQQKTTKIGVLFTFVEMVFLVISYLNIQDLNPTSISFGIPIFVLPISTVLFLLAGKAIKKDDDLVKSVDRIR